MQMTGTNIRVLSVLLHTDRPMYGTEIRTAAHVASGTFYPILERCLKLGWLRRTWEKGDPHDLGRNARCYWQLTDLGRKRVTTIFAEIEQWVSV